VLVRVEREIQRVWALLGWPNHMQLRNVQTQADGPFRLCFADDSCNGRSPSLFNWPSEDACFSFRSDWATADFALGIGSLAELETPDPFAKGCTLWRGFLYPVPNPFCLSSAPRLNCSMNAPYCSLPELDLTMDCENLVRRTHE
jgi:hypothetical protein